MPQTKDTRSKRDIVFLTDNYRSLGGVQRSTTTIANALFERGHNIRIVSVAPGAITMSHKLNPEISVTTCNPKIQARHRFANSSFGRKVRPLLTKLFNYWKPKSMQFPPPTEEGIRKLGEVLDTLNENSVVVVTNVAAMNFLNHALRQRTSRPPKIIGQHKGAFSAMPKSSVSRLVRTFATADLLLGLTEEDATLLSSVVSIPVSHIANPIPSAPPEYLNVPKEKHFVALGRLASEKSYESAILAWKPIAKSFPDWKLRIYGEGPLRSELEALIDKEGLTNNVSLPGKTETPLLALAKARANIVTSKHEGFGLTISEAATVGTPTIAFNSTPGIRLQLQHNENGLLVPPGDIPELTKAIKKMLRDDQLYDNLRANALEFVRRFEVEETMFRWERLFDRVLSS